MRKLFLLIPALLLTLALNAKEINVSSGTSNIIHYTIADSDTEDGDVLVLTDAGPYISTAGADDYTKLVKNLTIKAADGIDPVIKFEVPFRSTGGKTVKFIGITFDGTSLTGYDFYFRFYDDADNNLEFEDCEFKNISKYIFDVYGSCKANSLKFTDCDLHDNSSRGILNRGTLTYLEINGGKIYNFTGNSVLDNYENATLGKVKINGTEFYGNAKYIINGNATSRADSCIINNCYFHNNSRSAVYFAASTVDGVETCNGVVVKNSTFANNDMSASDGSVIEVRNYGATEASNIGVTVDHCTFYNNPTSASGYADIRVYKSTKVAISNCIFAHPDAYARCATYCYGGTITNCLSYNLTSGTNGHRQSGGQPVQTNNITENPLFTDAASGDYSFPNNWVTMSISPAVAAATDGSDLGDPRWYSAEVLPSSDFSTPYAFIGAKAVVNDKMELNGDNYIASTASGGTAYWKINITRACAVQVTLNMSDAVVTGHNYQVEIFDADNNSVSALNEGGWHNNVDDKTLTGSIQIPAIGNYKVVLTNNESGTTAVIKGITLAYAGGAIQNIPCTMMPIDALKSARAYVDGSGEFHFTTEEEHGHATEEWAKWRMHVTKDGYYKFTTSVNSNNGHSYLVTIYNADETVEKGSVAQSGDDIWGAPKTFSTGNILLEEGDYILKVQNTTANSNGRIVNVVASYEGGATITVPAEELIGAEAVLVDNGNLEVYKDGDNLQYDDNEFPLQEYVYWNINATRAGDMNLILNVVAPAVGDASGHQFLVELYTDLGGSPIASTAEAASSHATGPITLPVLNIPATGNYLVKLTNQTQWSSAILHSIQFTYAGGAVINVPGELVGEEAVLCKEDGGTLKMFHRPNGDIEYNDNGNPESEYALWNIHAAAACELSVTLNIAKEGHLFTVKLYNGSTLLGSAAETATTEWDNEPINLADHLTIPAAGDYTIKLINSKQWSHGALHSITLTEVAVAATVTLDEAATDNSGWVANVGGTAVNVELTRSFTGGMYNTISLPFSVESDAVETAFGAGVELMYMTSATLDGTVLDLEFASTTSIYQGTPYLIKPVANVVNPTFANVSFTVSDASTAATGGTAADFIGTFIKKTIPASTQNLYLQANNILQYSQDDVTIKGTRAYFRLTGSGSAAVVRPRLVLNGQVLTDIELVNGEPQVNGKFIENGQLIILRDGVRYNALGTRVK